MHFFGPEMGVGWAFALNITEFVVVNTHGVCGAHFIHGLDTETAQLSAKRMVQDRWGVLQVKTTLSTCFGGQNREQSVCPHALVRRSSCSGGHLPQYFRCRTLDSNWGWAYTLNFTVHGIVTVSGTSGISKPGYIYSDSRVSCHDVKYSLHCDLGLPSLTVAPVGRNIGMRKLLEVDCGIWQARVVTG